MCRKFPPPHLTAHEGCFEEELMTPPHTTIKVKLIRKKLFKVRMSTSFDKIFLFTVTRSTLLENKDLEKQTLLCRL